MSNDPNDSTFAPSASIAMLERRSALLRKLREFFYARDFIEVETPLLSSEIIPELHIEPIVVHTTPIAGEPRSPEASLPASLWLQSSPELHMKRLLAAGLKNIFQLTRSFRAGERGSLHNPEFTLAEWYRVGDDMQAGMNLLDDLTQSLLRTPPAARTSYSEAFERVLKVSPHSASLSDLAAAAAGARVSVTVGMNQADRDEWLNLLLASCIEPQLGRDRPEIVYHYPATQSSLAKVVLAHDGFEVAERFELYYQGIELANGFHELTDAAEQHRRFEEVNTARFADGRRPLPIPESLLAALHSGLPDCTGCALGFDRLAMLSADAQAINEVMAFPQCLNSRNDGR
jgi:elongation factor P--(R)-beta-lysine ligase